MRTTMQRWTGLLAILLAPLAWADAEHGGLEATSTTFARLNPVGLAEDVRLGYRFRLDDGERFLLPYAQIAVSPGSVQLGAGLQWGIVRGVTLTAAYAPRQYFGGRYGFQSFASPRADYRDDVLGDRADAGLSGSAWEHRFVLELDAGVPIGPFVARNVARAVKHHADAKAGDTVFYDAALDTLVPVRGWTFEDIAEITWHPDPHWSIGLRHTLVTAFYPTSAFRPGEPTDDPNGPLLRLGPVASYTFAYRGSGFFDAPTLFVDVGWWLKHRYRTGEDVSRAIPTAIVAFSFKAW